MCPAVDSGFRIETKKDCGEEEEENEDEDEDDEDEDEDEDEEMGEDGAEAGARVPDGAGQKRAIGPIRRRLLAQRTCTHEHIRSTHAKRP